MGHPKIDGKTIITAKGRRLKAPGSWLQDTYLQNSGYTTTDIANAIGWTKNRVEKELSSAGPLRRTFIVALAGSEKFSDLAKSLDRVNERHARYIALLERAM